MSAEQKPSKGLNIALWIIQSLLAIMFIMAGVMKSFQPIEQLATSLPWVADASIFLVRFIGISELLGGIGLLLPSILKIQPKLTGFAAIGILIIMILAAAYHGMRGEFEAIGMNVVIGALAGFVAWGRLYKAPIKTKS
ncbi:MAG: DoxX family protein [Bacteroidia bacterium]|nr:DoxX family protein [Bacteroidia bacterium]